MSFLHISRTSVSFSKTRVNVLRPKMLNILESGMHSQAESEDLMP